MRGKLGLSVKICAKRNDSINMLKLTLVVILSSFIASGFGKPLGDTTNEVVAETNDNNEDFERSRRSAQDVKPLEADSSTKPVESATDATESQSGAADAETLNNDEDTRSGKTEAVNEEVDASQKGTTDSVKELSETSRTGNTEDVKDTGDSRAVKSETTNVSEEKRSAEADELSLKRAVDLTNVDGENERNADETRRLLIGIPAGNEGDKRDKSKFESTVSGNLRSADGSSLDLEENLEHGSNLEEKGRSGSEKSEVNIDGESSRSSEADNAAQEKVSEQNRDGHDLSQFSESRSAKPNSAQSEVTSELQGGKVDHIAAAEENPERFGVPQNLENTEADHPNTRLNREDSASRSAMPNDEELEHSDGKEPVKTETKAETDVAPENRIAAAEDSKTGEKVEEKKAEGISESRSGQTAVPANAEGSSDKALESAPELITGGKSNVNENLETTGSDSQTRRMLSDDQHTGGDDRTGLSLGVSKEAVSPAGSPGDHSRLATTAYAPLGFPTTVSVPLPRSAHNHPSVIITRVPDSDIITLPHHAIRTSFLFPNRFFRRGLDLSNEIAHSDNGYKYHGEDKTAAAKEFVGRSPEVPEKFGGASRESPEKLYGIRREAPVDSSPESLLRVDDYADDFNTYNLRSHFGEPGANPEVRNWAKEGDESTQSRKNQENKFEVHSNKKAVDVAEGARSDTEALASPNIMFNPRVNYFSGLEPFMPGYENVTPLTNYVLPSTKDYVPKMESSFKPDAIWPRTLLDKLIQASTLANNNLPLHPQQNQLGFYNPYSLYFPTTT